MATFNDGEKRDSIRAKINASIAKTDAMDQGVATTDSPSFAGGDFSGNVGIGTSSPSATLDVNADALIHGATVGRGAGAISSNTAVGSGALSSNTTGVENTANGRQALRDNTSGSYNTANGVRALFSNTSGSGNTATGRSALFSNTTGNNNTANGYQALVANTTGNNNTANGYEALQSNTTGSNNTANGYAALRDNTTGDQNTANGRQALQNNTEGDYNTANGRDALLSNTTGNDNTANGRNALFSNTTGSDNTANGRSALYNNTTGNNNTANGRYALLENTEGSNNIGIGLDAGRSTSPRHITTASNEICIGNNDHTGAFIKIGFTVTSDARDKTALAPIPHGLDFVNALQPTEYQFKSGGRDGEADGIRRYGFLAQEVLAAEGDNPVIVNNDDPDDLKMTHDHLIPVLVNAVKELTAQVNDLKAEVAALKEQ